MSVASVHPAVISPLAHMLGMRCLSVASSLDKLSTYDNYVELHDLYHSINSDTVMSIEQLRAYNSSCFSCGVNWTEQHVSLDCSECGGYALVRPCADCDGKCGATWKRNSTLSHTSGKARWDGECALRAKAKCETRQTLREICQRFETSVNTDVSS